MKGRARHVPFRHSAACRNCCVSSSSPPVIILQPTVGRAQNTNIDDQPVTQPNDTNGNVRAWAWEVNSDTNGGGCNVSNGAGCHSIGNAAGTGNPTVDGWLRGVIAGFSISASGALSPLPGSPFTTSFASTRKPGGAVSVAVDPSGHFLYAASTSANQITGFSIRPATGILTPLASAALPTGNHPFRILVSQ